MKALCFRSFGGPEVLRLEEVADPVPGPGEALVRTAAIGLNFADVYRRKGTYHLAGEPPWIAGYEAAGVVEDPNGCDLAPGTRVAFADSPFANAERVARPTAGLFHGQDCQRYQQDRLVVGPGGRNDQDREWHEQAHLERPRHRDIPGAP